MNKETVAFLEEIKKNPEKYRKEAENKRYDVPPFKVLGKDEKDKSF